MGHNLIDGSRTAFQGFQEYRNYPRNRRLLAYSRLLNSMGFHHHEVFYCHRTEVFVLHPIETEFCYHQLAA